MMTISSGQGDHNHVIGGYTFLLSGLGLRNTYLLVSHQVLGVPYPTSIVLVLIKCRPLVQSHRLGGNKLY